jgi:hypothetical protein
VLDGFDGVMNHYLYLTCSLHGACPGHDDQALLGANMNLSSTAIVSGQSLMDTVYCSLWTLFIIQVIEEHGSTSTEARMASPATCPTGWPLLQHLV